MHGDHESAWWLRVGVARACVQTRHDGDATVRARRRD
jgi:hypothetical protein